MQREANSTSVLPDQKNKQHRVDNLSLYKELSVNIHKMNVLMLSAIMLNAVMLIVVAFKFKLFVLD
jgi:hypothetical protein